MTEPIEIDVADLIVRMVSEMPKGACPVGMVYRVGKDEYGMVQAQIFGTDFCRLLHALAEGRERVTLQ